MKTTITAALMIAVFALTTAAVAEPTGATTTKSHHACCAPPFPMTACIKAAKRIYGPAEARAACSDLRAGV